MVTLNFIFQAGSTVLAVMRYRQGITEEFAQTTAGDYPGTMGGGAGGPQPTPSPYSSYPAGGAEQPAADPYQQGGFQQPGGGMGGQMGGGQMGGGQMGGGQMGGQMGGGMGEQKMPPGDFQPPTY